MDNTVYLTLSAVVALAIPLWYILEPKMGWRRTAICLVALITVPILVLHGIPWGGGPIEATTEVAEEGDGSTWTTWSIMKISFWILISIPVLIFIIGVLYFVGHEVFKRTAPLVGTVVSSTQQGGALLSTFGAMVGTFFMFLLLLLFGAVFFEGSRELWSERIFWSVLVTLSIGAGLIAVKPFRAASVLGIGFVALALVGGAWHMPWAEIGTKIPDFGINAARSFDRPPEQGFASIEESPRFPEGVPDHAQPYHGEAGGEFRYALTIERGKRYRISPSDPVIVRTTDGRGTVTEHHSRSGERLNLGRLAPPVRIEIRSGVEGDVVPYEVFVWRR